MGKAVELREVEIAALKPYERNAKQHSKEQVEKIGQSIRRLGFISPCLIDRDLNVIAGHGRIMAAKAIGWDRVPCIFIEGLTEEERKAYILADNRLTELGDWDMDMVQEELAALADADFDISITGFDTDLRFDDSMAQITDDGWTDAEVHVAEEPRTRIGDIYQLGKHRLMCGDSTNPDMVDELMNGTVADITITSPPYGAANSAKIREHYVPKKKTRKSFYNEHEDTASEWGSLITGAMEQMRRVSKVQFVNIQMLADNKIELISILNKYRKQLIDIIIWDKCKAPPQMHDNVLNNQFEFIFIFGDDEATRVIPFASFHGNRNNMIALTVGNNEFAYIHRAVFPIQLPAELLKISSKAETVLDLFGGTGTTMMACEQIGRKNYTMELDPRYVDLIVDRWEKMTGLKALKVNGYTIGGGYLKTA